MIRECTGNEYPEIFTIINEAAQVYRGAVIPENKWKEPYMSESELKSELQEGVQFLGFYDDADILLGVMGHQNRDDVQLIRHAYVSPLSQGRGIGGMLLNAIRQQASKLLLVGTYTASIAAIAFYEKNGFRHVGPDETQRLLSKYWDIPRTQSNQSVVLADRADSIAEPIQ